ncbi:hypothetical protein THAOC_01827, partial [Thalassiosira oceanica]
VAAVLDEEAGRAVLELDGVTLFLAAVGAHFMSPAGVDRRDPEAAHFLLHGGSPADSKGSWRCARAVRRGRRQALVDDDDTAHRDNQWLLCYGGRNPPWPRRPGRDHPSSGVGLPPEVDRGARAPLRPYRKRGGSNRAASCSSVPDAKESTAGIGGPRSGLIPRPLCRSRPNQRHRSAAVGPVMDRLQYPPQERHFMLEPIDSWNGT